MSGTCSWCGSRNHTRSQCSEDPPDEFGRPRAIDRSGESDETETDEDTDE